MSLNFPYDFVQKNQRGHQARIRCARYDAWAAAHPQKALEQDLVRQGMTPELATKISANAFSSKVAAGTSSIPMARPLAGQSAVTPTPTSTVRPVHATSAAGAAIARGAVAGVIAGASVSVARSARALVAGNVDVATVGKRFAADVAVAGAAGAAVTATAEGIKAIARIAGPSGAARFVRGSAPAVIASGAVELVVDAYKGELSAKSATITVARTAVGWAGAEAGAALGASVGTVLAPLTGGFSVPVCALLGGLAGGIGASMGAQAFARDLFD